MRKDCEGSPYETSYRTWFHFSVSGASRGSVLTLHVRNMNKQAHLYRFGYKPVVKAVPSKPTWEHISGSVEYEVQKPRRDGVCSRAVPVQPGTPTSDKVHGG